MSFATLNFIFIFLPVVTFFFYFFKKYRFYTLIISSQLFYFFEGLDAIIFLNLAILIGFYLRKNLLFSLFLLFFILIFFKYSFYISNFFDIEVLSFLLFDIDLRNTTIFAGLSFYTFQLAGYLLERKNDLDLKKLLLFTSFFPQIISGPIIKRKLFLKNFKKMDLTNSKSNDDYKLIFIDKLLPNFLIFFSFGLFYKIVCADILAIYSENYSNYIFENHANDKGINFFIFTLYTFSYGFRIYFDFAGYSLMAIGIGYLFNFQLPKNFDEPYKQTTIKGFWRHWHITLSVWFREYVFTFIKKKYNFFSAIIITFFLSGVWHGAGLGFIYWGIYHGILYLIYNRFEKKILKLNFYVRLILLNILIMISWPFFDIGFEMYKYSLINIEFNIKNFYLPVNQYFSYFYFCLIVFVVYFFDEKKIIYRETNTSNSNLIYNFLKTPYFIALIFAFSVSLIKISKTFIYFRF